jgi:DNA-binding MarR family transcriptional regulator
VGEIMEKEELRMAFNKFLKMYLNACNEVYDELNFGLIKGSRFKYLKEIHKRKQTTLTELAEAFGLTKATVNEVINELDKINLITKTKSETDRRVTYISLTDVGTKLATTNELESKRAVDKIVTVLNEEEIEKLKCIFEKFGDSV